MMRNKQGKPAGDLINKKGDLKMVKGINTKERQDIERKIRTILRNARDFDLNEEDIKLALRNISKRRA